MEGGTGSPERHNGDGHRIRWTSQDDGATVSDVTSRKCDTVWGASSVVAHRWSPRAPREMSEGLGRLVYGVNLI